MQRIINYLLAILMAIFLLAFIFVVSTQAEAAWGLTVKEWTSSSVNSSYKLYYVIGVADTLVALDLQCPGSPRFGQIVAWADELIWKNDLVTKEPETGMMEVITRSLVAHGCKRNYDGPKT